MSVAASELGHSSLSAAMAEADPRSLASLKSQGVNFLVAVENAYGRFFFLHADDRDHANRLARNWVDQLDARACSIWENKGSSLSGRPLAIVAPSYDWGE